jgi:hypothetical protein
MKEFATLPLCPYDFCICKCLVMVFVLRGYHTVVMHVSDLWFCWFVDLSFVLYMVVVGVSVGADASCQLLV